MKNFVAYMLVIFFTVYGGMAAVNYFVDPGHIYSTEYIDKVVEGARKGLNVEGVTNIDERLYRLKFAEVYKGQSFDYLALGSSRIMTVSEDALKGASLLNMGVSGCKIEDMIALYQICKDYDIHFKHVMIAPDPTFFNSNDNDSRWKSIESYYNEFLGIHNEGISDLTLYKNLVSPSYFKSALVMIPSLLKGNNELRYVKTFINEGGAKRTDGSIYYDRKNRETPQTAIDNGALTWEHGSYRNFISLSRERVALFEKLLASFKKDGVDASFFFCPFHPSYYKRVLEMKGAVEAFKYVNDYARKNNIPVVGSFNPDDVGFKNTDFYDAAHARKESIDVLLKNELYVRENN